MPRFSMLIVLCIGLLSSTLRSAAQTAPTNFPTLKNLQAAYNGESNEQAVYQAFAVKADEEGFKGAAALFRAAAKAEGVHLGLHADAIKKLGAEPKAKIEMPDIKSTPENLDAARKGEDYERDVMYPAFIEQAQVDKNTGAIFSFKRALAADTEHAKLFMQALGDLDGWRTEKSFLVCPVCGFTTMDLTLTQCPVCTAPREEILDVH